MAPGSRPWFLTGTQGLANYSPERHQRAKETYQTHPGIAFHLDGYLSALLDGHHRALAAAEAGEPFNCVTITRASWYWQDRDMDQRPTGVTGLSDCRMEGDNLSAPAARWVNRSVGARTRPIPTPASPFPSAPIAEETKDLFGRSASLAASFPRVEEVSAAIKCKEISEEDVENAFESIHAYPGLPVIMDAFVGAGDPRARDLALRLAADENRHQLWPKALGYLTRFDDEEVLALFWGLVLREDPGSDEINKVVDEYVKRNADKYE
jgi:hypothetical protein